MNELKAKENIKVENMIYEIRGKQVMIDTDLAKLYGVETKRINEAVSRNKEKFPERYAFRISEKEYNVLKSHFATSKGGARKGHAVFTEQGVAMLATVLKSKIATNVSIAIMDAFVAMRKYISTNLIEQKYVNSMVLKHDNQIKLLQESFSKFEENKKLNEIYFDGQIYDAYSKIKDIFGSAKIELIIVDAYADKSVLDIIRNTGVKVTLIVKSKGLLTKTDIDKYNGQYGNLNIIYDDSFHDRYFILDNEIIYHCGTSINYAGRKTFSINKLEDVVVKKSLLNKIDSVVNVKCKQMLK